MALRFSNYGPEIPGNLVDSLLAGEVVFRCRRALKTRDVLRHRKEDYRQYGLVVSLSYEAYRHAPRSGVERYIANSLYCPDRLGGRNHLGRRG